MRYAACARGRRLTREDKDNLTSDRWIQLHSEDPDSRISEARLMEGAEVTVTDSARDEIEAPEEEFVELGAWQEEMKKELPAELQRKGTLPTPEMFRP